MDRKIICYYPEPKKESLKIIPVFIPFYGCKTRCIYCNQNVQTGIISTQLDNSYNFLKKTLTNLYQKNITNREVAFFGGTFTGLDKKDIERFLCLANDFKKKGIISKIRCSTRPDYIDEGLLYWLKELGLDTIELGIQSFDDNVLKLSKRGYNGNLAVKSCKMVKRVGLKLGIQLLPGLPGFSKRIWEKDIEYTIYLSPSFVRIYPCVVLKGTGLEKKYKKKQYIPLALETAKRLVARGVFRLWRHNIPVIRIGLHGDIQLTKNIVAGPYHQAFGTMVRSYILYKWLVVITALLGNVKKIYIPNKYQGEFFGILGALKNKYEKIGVTKEKINFHQLDYFIFIIK